MKEDHLESACLDWLGELGWTCVHGDEVSPGGAQCDRARYSDVALASRLREATVRLNPELTATEVDEAVDKLSGYGAQSLVDGNKEVYDWLRNGVAKHKYPPDKQVEATAKVIAQAELLADAWVGERSSE